jgi:hypothetical protein
MQIELLKEEIVLIKQLAEESAEDAGEEIVAFTKDSKNEEVTTALMVRAFSLTIKKKMEQALTSQDV